MLICTYIIFGCFWGAYAIRRQTKLYGFDIRTLITGLINICLWPLAIIIAIIKGE